MRSRRVGRTVKNSWANLTWFLSTSLCEVLSYIRFFETELSRDYLRSIRKLASVNGRSSHLVHQLTYALSGLDHVS